MPRLREALRVGRLGWGGVASLRYCVSYALSYSLLSSQADTKRMRHQTSDGDWTQAPHQACRKHTSMRGTHFHEGNTLTEEARVRARKELKDKVSLS